MFVVHAQALGTPDNDEFGLSPPAEWLERRPSRQSTCHMSKDESWDLQHLWKFHPGVVDFL